MFQSARLKLTAWYLCIIMLISVVFSIGMYKILTREFDRIERVRLFRHEHPQSFLPPQDNGPRSSFRSEVFSPEAIDDAKKRLFITLVLANLSILSISGAFGYFLAGRTLAPIKKMLDEQHRFITDASHELRTPLTAMQSEIEVAMRDKSLTKDGAMQLLRSNLEEVQKLQLLTEHLLELTNISQNPKTLFSQISFQEIINSAEKKVAHAAKKKHIRIEKNIVDVLIVGQKEQLTELFVILLDNAIKYSNSHGIVRIQITALDGKVSVAVRDKGIGIDKKDLPHIFDRFFRADTSRSKTPGYGLGLSIAKKIVDAHNGTILAASELKKGTTFTATFPKK